MNRFYCLGFETPPNLKARSQYLPSQENCGPGISSGTGFLFLRLIWVAVLPCRYSAQAPNSANRKHRSTIEVQAFPFWNGLFARLLLSSACRIFCYLAGVATNGSTDYNMKIIPSGNKKLDRAYNEFKYRKTCLNGISRAEAMFPFNHDIL
jgi:hypothetical protein